MKKLHFSWAFLALLLVALTSPMFSQSVTAGIRGTVTDPTGAAIPNLTVTATNMDTGVSTDTRTQSDGSYSLQQLPVGRYSITVKAKGFENFTASNITLNINQQYVQPVKLTLGNETQTIEVNAAAVQVDTTNIQLGNVVNAQQIVDLPLIGRNWTQLEQLEPGVVASSDRFGTYSANGAETQQTSFLLNGTDSNDLPLNTAVYVPSPDAIQQFNLVTGSMNPEYSRNSGAVVSATYKNGTNAFHGDAFEFYRDTFLNTHNYFQQTAPPYHQNLFGGTLGGPIWRDKIFFFLSYQGLRAVQPQSVGTNYVYSMAERGGNFSEILPAITASSGVVPAGIHVPTCTTGEPWSNCLAGGIVPGGSATFNPIALALMNQYIPLPNGPNNEYTFNPTTTAVQDQGIARIDANVTSKDQIWGVTVFHHAPSSDVLPFTGATLPGFGDVNTREVKQDTVDWVHTFNSTTLNELRAGFTRFNYGAVTPANPELPSAAGFAINPQFPGVASLPRIEVGSDFNLGFSNNGPQPRVDQNFQIDDNFTKIVGHHSLKFGWDGRRFQVDNPFYASNNGTYSYSITNNPYTTGSVLLDFLLGVPSGYSQGTGGRIDARAYESYVYGQDVWKIRPNLTLTLGAGWQVDTPFHNYQYGGEGVTCYLPGQQSTVFPTAPVSLNFPGDQNCSNTQGAVTAWKDVGPRVGFAWSPDFGWLTGGPGKTSVRGGFGIYFNRTEEETSLNNLEDPPFGLSSIGAADYEQGAQPEFGNPYTSIVTGTTYPNKFPATFPTPGQSVNFGVFEPFYLSQYGPNFSIPYAMNFNLILQRELPSNIVTTISYVGTLGRHEQITYDANPITPAGHAACLADPTCSNPDLINQVYQKQFYPGHALYPGDTSAFYGIGFIGTSGNSNYNALQVSATKGMTHGLLFQASYTYSHALDDASSYENAGYGGSVRGYNQWDTALNYGNSAFDARHRFVFSPVYEIPNWNHAAGMHWLPSIVGSGWRIAGILTLQTGFPFDISYGGSSSRSLWCPAGDVYYACPDAPSQTGPISFTDPRAGGQSAAAWFSPNNIVDEPVGSFGNISRNKYHGPGINNTDFAIYKNFYFSGEHQRYIEIGIESYNVFNHTQFNNPDGNFADGLPSQGGTFGLITSAYPGRQTQLRAKIYF